MHRAILVIAFTGACTFQPARLTGPVDTDAAPGAPPDAAPAAPPDAAPLDAAGPAVRCDFASVVESQSLTPALVAGVNSPEVDRDPVVTPDGETLFLMSSRPGSQSEDIWTATRAGQDADFSAPVQAAELNSSAQDTRVSLTADQRLLVMTSARIGGNFDVYRTERESIGDPFPDPQPIVEVNTGGAEHDPVISLDGLRLYLSAPGPAGSQDILMAERSARDQSFSTPQSVPGINTAELEADPAFTADELLIVFARGGDLYYATRMTTDQGFSEPQPLTAINTGSEESDPFVTADGCEFFFASDRPGGMGSLDIYRVRLGP